MAPVLHQAQGTAHRADQRVTLWTAGDGSHAIACVAGPHPVGLELQYLLDGRPLMCRVYDSWDRLAGQAQRWRDGLTDRIPA
jgi:hypothetical protein